MDALSFSRETNPARWHLQIGPLRRLRMVQRALGVRTCRCTYLGARLDVDLGDALGFGVATNRYERPEFGRLARACERIRPTVFVDVGACFGVYSCVVGKRNLAERIVAIEPEPEHFATLTANINLNGLSDRATLFHAAVGAQHGSRVNLAHPAAHNRGLIHVAENGQHCSAEVVALDRLPLPQSGKIAVKIDVEGYELEVLRGARDFFSANFGYAQIEALGQNSNIVRARMKETGWDLVDTHGPNFMFERHV